MTTNVFAIASSSAQAHDIVNRLKAEGFLESDISALLPDKGATRDFAHESHTKAPEGAVAGAGAGASFGATAGLPVSVCWYCRASGRSWRQVRCSQR